MKSRNFNFLEPLGPLRDCNGIVLILRLFCVLKDVPLYVPTVIEFVQPKKFNNFTAIYFVSILRPSCYYISVHKIIFIPNLAQYMYICLYINIWSRNFKFVRLRLLSSILTESYQKNT